MVTIGSRASWGARFRDGDLTLHGLAGEVFVHHSVTAHLSPAAGIAAEHAQMRHIEQIGQTRFGAGISYNVLIFPSGRAYQGVSWNRRGTHTGGRNSTSRSIAFAGNTDVHPPTDAAIRTAGAIFAFGRGRWWTAGAPLRGHRDVTATACPGRHAWARMGDIRNPAYQEDDDMFSDQDRSDVQEALRLLRLVVLTPSGHAAPATAPETIYVQTVNGVTENTAEARRQGGVLLGALAPAPGESRP